MTDQPFVHLHVHTEFSLLDGFSRIPKLVDRAAELGMKSLAITDHGVMFGVIDFYRAAKKAGIKPILGMEGYMTAPNRPMSGRDGKLDRTAHHMLLLAKNETGYKNLLKIASAAQLEGYYYRPRIDNDFLAAHSEGLIGTSGCLAGQIPSMIMDGRDDAARDLLDWYLQVFGKENFFVELQDHDIEELKTVNNWLIEIGRRDDVNYVATNDVHYVMDSDYDPHDTLLCIQTSELKSEEKRLRMSDNSYFLSSGEQMWKTFGHIEDGAALLNTVKIAEMCEIDLDQKGYHLPSFPVPEGYDPPSYLRKLGEKGLRWRYGSRADDADLRERLDYELGIIGRMGFDTYFLIVWDLCQFAHHADIWWNVRGSGAGSIVSYSLGISNIDPIENHLFFERFLNPGRVSMPDIDMDFPDDRRGEMVSYAARKYGEDKVAAIITFGTLGAKAAVRDVGRALNVDLTLVTQAARLIPTEPHPKPVHEYVEDNPELKKMYNTIPEIHTVIDTAASLQGISRHASTHAAGIIIADKALNEYVPLHRLTKEAKESKDGEDGEGSAMSSLRQVTQFPMATCESIGLLKVDFLGLSTLTYMRRACDLIAKHRGITYDMSNIPYRPTDDPEQNQMLKETFEMLGRGETVGVFQLESSGMQGMLRDMRPTKFDHIVAGVALYRPGPMDNIPTFNRRLRGDEPVSYHHELLRPILEETFGIIVYQEQIMRVGRELFGYTLGDADLMRKAVSKKKKEDLLKHRDIFLSKGPEHGVGEEAAGKIFDDIEFFANYGFPRAHASDYAAITCQSAFLKCHYPAEYMAALLSVYYDDAPKVTTFLIECKRLNIQILPPDINYSELDFDIQANPDGTQGIRFGMAAIKNAGVGALQHIIEERNANGQFANLEDFCSRVDLRTVGKRTVESLIKVGALKSMGDGEDNRKQLIAALDRIMNYSGDRHKAKEVGQVSLFGDADSSADDLLRNLPLGGEVSQREMLNWEKELLGLYISSHPIDPLLAQLGDQQITSTLELKAEDASNEMNVTFVGLIAALRKVPTKNHDMMGIATLEDRFGTIDTVLFPRTWTKFGEMMIEGAVVKIIGRLDLTRNDPQIICERVDDKFTSVTSDNASVNETPSASLSALSESMASWDSQETEPPPPPPFAATNGNGNGHAPVDSAPASNEPPSFDELPPLDDEAFTPFIPEHVERPKEPLRLRFRFLRNGDEGKDRRRLERLVGVITSQHGRDHFEIVLVTEGVATHIMDFPNHTTCYGDKLLKDLSKIDGVELDPVAGVS